MGNAERQSVKKDCPSFYTEKIKKPRKQSIMDSIAGVLARFFRAK